MWVFVSTVHYGFSGQMYGLQLIKSATQHRMDVNTSATYQLQAAVNSVKPGHQTLQSIIATPKIACILTEAELTPATTVETQPATGMEESGVTQWIPNNVGKDATCLFVVSYCAVYCIN